MLTTFSYSPSKGSLATANKATLTHTNIGQAQLETYAGNCFRYLSH